jgi:addiction module RelE/StbE family toxin
VKRAVDWTDRARNELLEIAAYIAQDNPNAAERVTDWILETAAKLGDFATGRAGRILGTREKIVSNYPYIIVYRIVVRGDDTETVAIMRVIHTARGWPAEI